MADDDDTGATACHEAGHAVALHDRGCKVERVIVDSPDSGETVFDALPDNDDDVVLVALAGVQAESHCDDAGSAVQALNQYIAARGDRNAIAKALKNRPWLSRGINWYQPQYNRALKFVQEKTNAARIAAIAKAVLSKPGFPKVLKGDELRKLLED